MDFDTDENGPSKIWVTVRGVAQVHPMETQDEKQDVDLVRADLRDHLQDGLPHLQRNMHYATIVDLQFSTLVHSNQLKRLRTCS